MNPLSEEGLPKSVSESIVKIGDFELRCYQLDDGHRILNADDVKRFFGGAPSLILAEIERLDKLAMETK